MIWTFRNVGILVSVPFVTMGADTVDLELVAVYNKFFDVTGHFRIRKLVKNLQPLDRIEVLLPVMDIDTVHFMFKA